MQSGEATVSSKQMKRTSTHANSKDMNQSYRNTQNFNQSQYEEPQNVLQMLRQQSIQNQTIIKTKQPKQQSDDNSYKQIPLLSKTITISQRKSTTGLEEQSPYLRHERYNSNLEEQIKAMEQQLEKEELSPDRDFSSLSVNPLDQIPNIQIFRRNQESINNQQALTTASPLKTCKRIKEYEPIKIKRFSLISTENIFDSEKQAFQNQKPYNKRSSNGGSIHQRTAYLLNLNKSQDPINFSRSQKYHLPDATMIRPVIGGSTQLRDQLLCQRQQLIRRIVNIRDQLKPSNDINPNIEQMNKMILDEKVYNYNTPELIKMTAQITRQLKRNTPRTNQNISYSNLLNKVNHSVHESQPSQDEFDGQITGKNITSPKIPNLIKDCSNYIIDGKDYNSKRQSQRSLGTTSHRKNFKLQREIPDTQPFLRKDISQGVFINKEIISSNYSYEQNQWTNQTDVTPFVKMLDKNMIQWERKKQVLNKMYEQDKKYNDYKFQKQYFSPPKELIVRNESYNSNMNKASQRQQNNRNTGHVFINKSAFQNYKKLVNMANYQAEVRTSHL